MARRRMFRKKPFRSRRTRRFGRRRSTRKYASGKYFVLKQKVNLQTLSVNCTASNLGAYTFSMSQIPDAANVANLYDEYKIAKVKLTFRPTANVAQAAAGMHVNPGIPGVPYNGLGLIHTCLDYNDGTAPANALAVTSYRNSRTTRSNKIHTRIIAPKAQGQLYRGALAGYYPITTFIPVAYSDTPHYAIKYCLEGGPGDNTFISYQVAVQAQITLIFRNQH